MVAIRSTADSAAKYSRRAGSAGPEYEAGVRQPRKDWKTETKAAQARYEAGVQQAITDKRFGKGVDKAGTAKWQENAIAKGPGRYSEGVRLAENSYADAFAPFQAVIAGLTLPPRGPKGDPNNIKRVEVIAKALHDAKIARAGR